MDDLIAKLEAAESGSRELDVAIWDALGGWSVNNPPSYTTSLDAALALAERVLPGWFLSLDTSGVHARLWIGERPSFAGLAATAPLALCIAILKATREKSNG